MASQQSKTAGQMGTDGGQRPNGRVRPHLHQRSAEIQAFGSVVPRPIGLGEDVCKRSVDALNLILADTMVLRDLYKKHHWQVSGPTFYQLHLLFDAHFEQQSDLVDLLAERVQLLGGVSVALAHDVAELTRLERAPRGREEVPVQLSRLLEAHESILTSARESAKAASDAGDEGTNDLLISDVVRTNEKQAWFVAEHLVKMPLVDAE